jgi:hypothetical protein
MYRSLSRWTSSLVPRFQRATPFRMVIRRRVGCLQPTNAPVGFKQPSMYRHSLMEPLH